MKIRLSTAGVKDAIERVNFLKDNIETASQDIVQQLVEYGEQKANEYNSTAPQSGLEKSYVIARITTSGNKGYVALQGPNSVYDEFGTGEEGASDPHPRKNSVSRPLNPYNSGPIVSQTIDANGRHYWIYSPMAGRPYFQSDGRTYGIPSGKQMYRTANDIMEKKNEVIKKTLGDAIRRINR